MLIQRKLLLTEMKKAPLKVNSSSAGSVRERNERNEPFLWCRDDHGCDRKQIAFAFPRLMALLVHLGVLAIRRLRVVSHALRQAWTLCPILRGSIITRGCGLVADGW